MPAFLSDDWFTSLNARLAVASSSIASHRIAGRVIVVFEFSDAPAEGPHAMTFTVTDGHATLSPGDHLAADVVIRLSRSDAEAIATGDLHGGRALREGRLKVRGDVNAVSDFGAWIVAAQASTP